MPEQRWCLDTGIGRREQILRWLRQKTKWLRKPPSRKPQHPPRTTRPVRTVYLQTLKFDRMGILTGLLNLLLSIFQILEYKKNNFWEKKARLSPKNSPFSKKKSIISIYSSSQRPRGLTGAGSSPNKTVWPRDRVLVILHQGGDGRELRWMRRKYIERKSAWVDYVNFARMKDMRAHGVATKYLQTLRFAQIGILTGFVTILNAIFQAVEL